jgi:hypothetical protein
VHGRLGRPQAGQPHGPDEPDHDAGEEADGRIDQRREERHQGRADDEDHLVDDRLEREGRLPPLAVEGVRPPGADHRADVRSAQAAQSGEDEPRPGGRVEDDGSDERDAEDEVAGEDDGQDDALTASVDGSGPLRAGQRADEGQRAGHGAGQAVAAGLALDEQDGAEAEDRHRQARQPPGEGEGTRAGDGGEDLDVGTEDGAGRHGSLALPGHKRVRGVTRRSLGWRYRR